ncbi:MAG: hypothetical protein KGJ13_10855, partial [Patescibacteria group bacterium]|nr:hypothetical protein [Patescibacteria group bacterium]
LSTRPSFKSSWKLEICFTSGACYISRMSESRKIAADTEELGFFGCADLEHAPKSEHYLVGMGVALRHCAMCRSSLTAAKYRNT